MIKIIILTVVGVICVALFSPNDFYVGLASRFLIASIYAVSLNILVGHAGLMSLGSGVFYGVSAYLFAWLAGHGWNSTSAVAMSLAGAGGLAAVFGLIALRSGGSSFMMTTLALGQIVWGIAYRWVSVTGGDNGLGLTARPSILGVSLEQPKVFMIFSAVVFVVAMAFVETFLRSPFGTSLRGVRDQPRRMSALGFNMFAIRWVAFVASGFLIGVAGLLDCFYEKFVSPNPLSLSETTTTLLMVVVGGTASVFGPLVGVALVLGFSEFASSVIYRWHAAFGVLLLLVVVFMPKGILPALQKLKPQNVAMPTFVRRLAGGRVR